MSSLTKKEIESLKNTIIKIKQAIHKRTKEETKERSMALYELQDLCDLYGSNTEE